MPDGHGSGAIHNTYSSYCPDRCNCPAHVEARSATEGAALEPTQEPEATESNANEDTDGGMTLAEFDQALEQARRKRIAEETRRATIKSYETGPRDVPEQLRRDLQEHGGSGSDD